MKRFAKPISVGLAAIGIIYLLGFLFYSTRFQANSLYAGSDISHLTIERAKEQLESDFENNKVQLLENGNIVGELALGQIYSDFDPAADLETALSEQNAGLWLGGLFKNQPIKGRNLNEVSVDEAKIATVLETIGIDNSNRSETQNASLNYTEETGFTIQEEAVGTQINLAALSQAIIEALSHNEASIELSDYYYQPTVTAEDESIVTKWQQVKRLSDTKITYTMSGQEVTIPAVEIEKWIFFNSNGDAYLDEASVQAYVAELDAQYASLYQPRQFQSTLQGVVTIDPQIYGWTFDYEAETAALISEVYAGEDVKRQPHYKGNIFNNDITQADDIGNTHVEIDLNFQMLYVYIDGEMMLSTQVVTGLPPLMETIPGAWHILYKERDATLEGFNIQVEKEYSTPVEYWIPFDWEGMGMHDAWWQSTFGGNVWTYAGSNGCINIPVDVMPKLFDLVETGMPVIIF